MIRIKELRNEKKMRQIDFAKQLGISQATLSYWERGEFQPDNEALEQLADFFNVSVDYLLGRTNERNSTEAVKYSGLTKGQKRMVKIYERLSASDDPKDRRDKLLIDSLLGLEEPEDE